MRAVLLSRAGPGECFCPLLSFFSPLADAARNADATSHTYTHIHTYTSAPAMPSSGCVARGRKSACCPRLLRNSCLLPSFSFLSLFFSLLCSLHNGQRRTLPRLQPDHARCRSIASHPSLCMHSQSLAHPIPLSALFSQAGVANKFDQGISGAFSTQDRVSSATHTIKTEKERENRENREKERVHQKPVFSPSLFLSLFPALTAVLRQLYWRGK